MAAATESPRQFTLTSNRPDSTSANRIVPIPTTTSTSKMSAPSPSPGEPMSVDSNNDTNHKNKPTAQSPTLRASTNSNEDSATNGTGSHSNSASPRDGASKSSPPFLTPATSGPPPPAAAAAVHQPKIVQTAFIHKLYNMLEDPNIQHLISWSATADSFVMSPSADFSKVLSQYFKHTNISSFVRQLNMYGFHKVSDVFHTSNPDTALWEFKHGGGNFKRGDLIGLREIKRRASRHALVHREYGAHKPSSAQPGSSADMPPLPQDMSLVDHRIIGLEHAVYDLGSRLQRSEEANHHLHAKQQSLIEAIGHILQVNQEFSRVILTLSPPDNPIHHNVLGLQSEMMRYSDVLRSLDDHYESLYQNRAPYTNGINPSPVSPHHHPPIGGIGGPPSRPPQYRPPFSSNLSITTPHYGSASNGSSNAAQISPSSHRDTPPILLYHSHAYHPNTQRRHTTADIQAHGWAPPPTPSFNQNPHPPPPAGAPSTSTILPSISTAPPPPSVIFNDFSWNGPRNSSKELLAPDSSIPPTRRGSMAHILNPANERQDDDEGTRGDDDRKRKRMQ